MPIESIKIPQNVYIEDHIVGPLTLKQLIISAVGCGFSYAVYSILLKGLGGAVPLPVTVLVWLPGVLSILFAFIKINDLSMFHILLLLIEKSNKPSTRMWQPRRGISINIRTSSSQKKEQTPAQQDPTKNSSHLEELSSILDQPFSHTTPVNPVRISVTPLVTPMDTPTSPVSAAAPAAETNARVSIFRDLSPRDQ